MVLIVSNTNDYSTNRVIDWISLTKDFKVLRDALPITMNLRLDDENETFVCNDIETSTIKSFWYRRGLISNSSNFFEKHRNKTFNEEYCKGISKSVQLDIDRIDQYFHLHFANSNKTILGNFLQNTVNKINTLRVAKESGLHIPLTLVTSKKTDVEKTFKQNKFITKPIGEASIYFDHKNKTRAYTYTGMLSLEDLDDEFHISLFQENIEKKYELRTFVLDRKCYSMAIFSQKNDKTKLDFRNYDQEYPNRTVPYRLSIEIEEKINDFMEKMDLNSGSIDFLITPENKVIFLEINPLGQFGMVSYPCNYNLEKKIAAYLTNY